MGHGKQRTVVIFGGAGFIGSNLAERLLATTDATVHIFDNLSRRGVRRNLAALRERFEATHRLKFTHGDVRDAEAVQFVVRGATEIYHFAAQVAVTTSVEDPREDFEVNLIGTFNVLEAVRKAGTKPFLLFTSTNKVYGDLTNRALVLTRTRWRYADGSGVSEAQPLDFHSPYGCSKGAADQYVRDYSRIYDIPTVVFRMSCIAGPRQFGNEDQGWVAHFLYSAMDARPVTIYGDGRQVRDVLCVTDLLDAFEAARSHLSVTEGQIYNIGGGPENTTSLVEIMAEIQKLTGKPLQHRNGPRRPGDQLVYVTDCSKFTRDTRWQPTVTVVQTLQKIYEWRLANAELFRPEDNVIEMAVQRTA